MKVKTYWIQSFSFTERMTKKKEEGSVNYKGEIVEDICQRFFFWCSTVCSISLWDPFSGLILEGQFKLVLFTMVSMYILLLSCTHLEVIFLDIMDRNRNNAFFEGKNTYVYCLDLHLSCCKRLLSLLEFSWVFLGLNSKCQVLM